MPPERGGGSSWPSPAIPDRLVAQRHEPESGTVRRPPIHCTNATDERRTMSKNAPAHLAIDLGASGGRVIAGSLENDKLCLEATHRFPNEPVRVQHTLQWDTLGLWREILRGLG